MVNPDFRDLFAALNEAEASFLVVGAHAVAFYAEPRYTKDLDIWVDASPGNAPRVLAALQAFGAPLAGVTESDFHEPGAVLQIGVEPNRIDVITQIDGVAFEAKARLRVGGPVAGHMARTTFDREARAIQSGLAPLGTPRRAAGSKAYLKSELRFLGNDTATQRQEARTWRTAHADWAVDALCGLTDALWRREVFELRSFALILLVKRAAEFEPRHLPFLEKLLRDSHTWALVDEIAPRLVGPLLVQHPREVGRVLDRWATDEDFWIRRAALLALLLPMRRGEGDWKRFERYADPLLEDREFFIRKAIGWLLREAVKTDSARVVAFVEPRAGRLSGVTWREATRNLPARQRQALDRHRR